jgi:hypothetical protein
MCASAHRLVAGFASCLHRMGLARLQGRASMMLFKPKTEAHEFLKEAFPFPSVLTALAVLAAGDVAIVVSMLLWLG